MKIGKRIKLPKVVRDFNHEEEIILRDHLSLERTRLANERTLFAYIRTSLYLLLGGIALLKLEDFTELQWLGYVSLIVSGLLICYGLVRFYMLRLKLNKFYRKVEKLEDELEKESSSNI